MRPSFRLSQRWRGIVLVAMALLLLGAATLGQLHRALHALPTAAAMAVSDPADATAFHADGDANQCRLYDQLASSAGPIAPPVLALPALLPAATFHFLRGEALARWAALYDARGPPCAR